MKRHITLLLLLFALAITVAGGEHVDLQVVSRLRMEGFGNSQVMEIMSYLTDVAGPRLTGSPNILWAGQWARDEMTKWGLENAHLEPWGEFGRGWTMDRVSVTLVKPYHFPLIAYAKAWTDGTNGPVAGKPIRVEIAVEEDFEKYRGKLQGAMVMTADPREVEIGFEADASRHDDETLEALAEAPTRGGGRRNFNRREFQQRRRFGQKVAQFLKDEGVALMIEPGRGAHGTVFVGRGGSFAKDGDLGIPSLVMAAEHYGMLSRILAKEEIPLEVSVDIRTSIHDQDLQGYNVIGEIPGTDLRDEVVMLGGHLDSWHSGTGATDNASGCAVALEAVRILKAINMPMRRTVRIALWSGEEQGLLGSRNYVKQHFGEAGKPTAEHETFSAYFNLDNGTGRIRGVYLQGNDAVRPIFKALLEPWHDLGAKTLTIRNTGGTDHLAFDGVGLPGFQFIQDPVAYSSRTHHSNMDVYDHTVGDDLRQAAVIMASFVYHTANLDAKLPRKPAPVPSEESRVTSSGSRR